jgi:hypothetical protein
MSVLFMKKLPCKLKTKAETAEIASCSGLVESVAQT